MTPTRRIAAVQALPGHRLHVTWQDSGSTTVDLTGLVHRKPIFAPLKDEAAFSQVDVIDYGTGIEWANGLDYSADSLEILAQEQSSMAPAEFRTWKAEMQLSTNEMADIFGMSASAIKAYLSGSSVIPIAVQIACHAMRDDPDILYARFRPRVAGRPRKKPTAA